MIFALYLKRLLPRITIAPPIVHIEPRKTRKPTRYVTVEEVKAIRKGLQNEVPRKQLALQYRVSMSTINRIATKTWKPLHK